MQQKDYLTKKILFIVITFSIILTGCSSTKDPIIHSEGSGDYNFTILHDNLLRFYIVHTPPQYQKGTPMPVVLALHGGGGSAGKSVDFYNLNDLADKEGFIVVYPEGTGKTIGFGSKKSLFGTWNADRCCQTATTNNIDDVGYFNAMLDKIEQNFSVDPKRVYAMGHSNGMMMSFKLACATDRIAAIAGGGGHDTLSSCNPTKSVAVLYVAGTEDKCDPYNGAEECGGCVNDILEQMGLSAAGNTWQCKPIPDYIKEWSIRNHCETIPKTTFTNGTATCLTYSSCKDNADVTLCTLEGMGHKWAGRDDTWTICTKDPNSKVCTILSNELGAPNNDLDETTMAWEFFKQHPAL